MTQNENAQKHMTHSECTCFACSVKCVPLQITWMGSSNILQIWRQFSKTHKKNPNVTLWDMWRVWLQEDVFGSTEEPTWHVAFCFATLDPFSSLVSPVVLVRQNHVHEDVVVRRRVQNTDVEAQEGEHPPATTQSRTVTNSGRAQLLQLLQQLPSDCFFFCKGNRSFIIIASSWDCHKSDHFFPGNLWN